MAAPSSIRSASSSPTKPSSGALATFHPKFRPLFKPARYKVFHGGRGSAKSWSVAKALLIESAQQPLRVLCAREFQNSIAESVHKLLADQIELLGMEQFFRVTEKSITGPGGTEFVFKGLRHNINSVKSMEGYDRCWVEEAQTVSKDSWEKLIPTMRKPGSEIWVTFNPDLEEDDTYQRFIVQKRENAVVVEVNFTDNPWLSQELKDEAEHLKSVDLDAYENVWLGRIRRQIKNAIWNLEIIGRNREGHWTTETERLDLRNRLKQIVVAVDPSGCSAKEDLRSDEIGIVVAGVDAMGVGYVLEDLSGRYAPEEWATVAVGAYDRWKANRIVAEINFGGALVTSQIRSVRRTLEAKVVTASRGKFQRAEPVAALYTQDRVKHCAVFAEMERQMCLFSQAGYQGKRSPDRADALVWALSDMMLDEAPPKPARAVHIPLMGR